MSDADRCPGALRLYESGDGWLARIRIPGGRLDSRQFAGLTAAAELGNGLLDLTSRANVQVRGLPGDAAARLAAILVPAGLLPAPAHERVRNIVASPYAGRHPAALGDSDPVVAALDHGLCADRSLAALPGRFLFAVDDGSGGALPSQADVALIAEGASIYRLGLAGVLTGLRPHAADAAALALTAARAFLAVRGAAWRIRDLPQGASVIAARLGSAIDPAASAPADLRATPGRLVQADGALAVTGLARLGRLDAAALRALANLDRSLMVSPSRTITACDVDAADAPAIERAFAQAGLEISPSSGWTGLTACAGAGVCARARVDVRAAAARRAAIRPAASPAEHWSACERRCGERAGQPVSIAAEAGKLVVRADRGERRLASVDAALAVLA